MTSAFSPKKLNALNTRERQQATIAQFNAAMDAQDTATAIDIANYVVSDDDLSNHAFSRGWQLHCLKWLIIHHMNEWRNSEDNSEHEDKSIHALLGGLWKLKWIIGILPQDIGETRQDFDEAIEFMQHVYEDFEFSTAMVDKAQLDIAMLTGDAEAARKHFAQWQAADKDDMNDCEACEQSTLIDYYHFIGDYQRAAELAAPIISGEMTCGEVPHITYPSIINSLIQIGKFNEAQAVLQDAVDLITKSSEHFLWLIPQLIQLSVRLENREQAEELLDEFSHDIVEAAQNNHFHYLQYLIAVAPFNEEALEAARNLARDFDERNGNQYYQNQLDLMFVTPVLH
ncbi:hypothetical protein [Wielerella bovis]|uniref:hypothetical protein n=1 Tax=Wielerella bovis TaxID=2917790 RepID=UPI002018855F|nr:hypothetical protein [Wielerella bovis]ULJ60845.1 hypothetical protein MIS44_02995 [Wielerella bovis]